MRSTNKIMKLVLGSSSSSRRLVLSEMGFKDVTVVAADIDERSIGNRSEAGGAESLVKLLANEKADAILEKFYSCTDCSHEEFLITADQVVTFQGRILEKPITTEEAREFISGYSGNCCSTVGSIAVTRLRDKKRVQGVDISTIFFKVIPMETVEALIEEGDVFYSAGALLVENPLMTPYLDRIDGSFDGVLGLSKSLLAQLLNEISVE